MLQPQTINRKDKGNDIQTEVACFIEKKCISTVLTAKTSIARIQTMIITLRYARFDSVRCFSGQ